METIIEGLKIAFFGVLMFSIIVTIHEAGHFTAARLFGLRVKEFMLGLPGPNIGVTFKGTKFGVTPILLGGYALIAGENSTEENPNLAAAYVYLVEHGKLEEDQVAAASADLGYDLEEALDILDAWGTIKRTKSKGRYIYSVLPGDNKVESESSGTGSVAKIGAAKSDGLGVDDGSARRGSVGKITAEEAEAHIAAERKLTFNAAPWYKRVIILAAGVIFNLIFAIVVITAAYMINGVQTPTTTLELVTEGSPAAEVGIQPGDRVVSIDGAATNTWEEIAAVIAAEKPGTVVEVVVEQEGSTINYELELADNNGAPMMGISPSFERQPMSFGDAFTTSISYIGLVCEYILKLFNPTEVGEVVSQSSSVIGVSFIARDAANAGFLPFITVAAALSISIGLMNLLPFPPLDGGRIVVETIERISGRRIPTNVIGAITMAALGLLILLFVVVMWQDIQRFILGG